MKLNQLKKGCFYTSNIHLPGHSWIIWCVDEEELKQNRSTRSVVYCVHNKEIEVSKGRHVTGASIEFHPSSDKDIDLFIKAYEKKFSSKFPLNTLDKEFLYIN